jgi:transposase
MEERIKRLEDIIQRDSHNSHKPPSSDEPKKVVIKNQREKSQRGKGGQKGHSGFTLKMSENPDRIIVHRVEKCSSCGRTLRGIKSEEKERRQVYDIPEIKIEIEEHQSEKKVCRCGAITVGEYPEGIEKAVQYGKQIKTMVIYFMNRQYIPYDRMQEVFKEIYSHNISKGTLYNINEAYNKKLEVPVLKIKETLQKSEVLHEDETGIRVDKELNWVHVSGTKRMTYYEYHKNRGKVATDAINIIPDFKGVLVHDGLKSYMQYACKHAYCNAHHLRELKFIEEENGQKWAKEMIELLLEIKEEVEDKKGKGLKELTEQEILINEIKFKNILRKGYKTIKYKRKATKIEISKSKNLLNKFKEHQRETLGFMYDFQVPFDNNLAERDLRMIKLKQKISGCFRSRNGAKFFCNIRSFISSAVKQKLNLIYAIKNIWLNNCILRFQAE